MPHYDTTKNENDSLRWREAVKQLRRSSQTGLQSSAENTGGFTFASLDKAETEVTKSARSRF